MSGWHSLSGYLYYRNGGPLGRLKSKKRLWHVLEDSCCQILQYTSGRDIRVHKAPVACIDIKTAAITLDLDHQNQFIILCDKKEHIFTAENHESMMIWLLGLQARRDSFSQTQIHAKQEKDSSDSHTGPHDFRPPFLPHPGVGGREESCRDWQNYGTTQPVNIANVQNYTKANRKSHNILQAKAFSLDSNFFQDSSSDVDSDDVFHGSSGVARKRNVGSRHHVRNNNHSLLKCSHSVPITSDSAIVTDSGESCVRGSNSVGENFCVQADSCLTHSLTARLTDLEKELITTKCELAKIMNQQTWFQEVLQQRDERINSLENKVKWCEAEGKFRQIGKIEREIHERVRVLQNQNRFLNEEVKKLAKIRQQDLTIFSEYHKMMQGAEADVDKWKMDYVFLIESSIRYPGGDTMDEAELSLFGGDRHKFRVKQLLEEARFNNPSLPTYDSLASGEVHVDSYGFKHQFDVNETGLLLHYLCQQLSQHYSIQASSYDLHQREWAMFIKQHSRISTKHYKQLKKLCRGGIPDQYRKQVWHQLVQYKVRDILEDKGEHYFRNLCNMVPDSPMAACYRKQVSLDLMRTMPNNVKFSSRGSKGIMDLQDVLLAFCIHNPTIGYCQGMNFIVGMSLLFLDANDAFWSLVAVTECFFPVHYFDHSLVGAQADQQVLKDILQQILPGLHAHLDTLDIELSTVTLNWFLAIFFDAVPFQTLLRIWDIFLLEGPKVLFRFSIAILKSHEKEILQKTDTISIMRHLKACARLTFDVDGLTKTAFEELKPFARRQDIASKQACYLNLLKEQCKKRDLQKLAFAEREQLYITKECEAGNTMAIECCSVVGEGKIWLCYSDQMMGQLCCVNCDNGTMYHLSLQLNCRVMCMLCVSPDTVVLGTLSRMLYAYNTKTRAELWQMQLHDAVLSLACCHVDDGSGQSSVRIFAGLADGTAAVMESTQQWLSVTEIFYIPIDQAPITCLSLVGDHIWCASGNTVHIIQAKTLDTVDSLLVSMNPYDHILSMVPGESGVWISLRGSSILELWDENLLCCKLLYDTRTDKHPQVKKEDDCYFNRARITAILSDESTVWIGTGEGDLIIYEVTCDGQNSSVNKVSVDHEYAANKETENRTLDTVSVQPASALQDSTLNDSSIPILSTSDLVQDSALNDVSAQSASTCPHHTELDDDTTPDTTATEDLHDTVIDSAHTSVPSASGCQGDMTVHDTNDPEPSTSDHLHDTVLDDASTSDHLDDTELDDTSTPIHLDDMAMHETSDPEPPASDHLHNTELDDESTSGCLVDIAQNDTSHPEPSTFGHLHDTTMNGTSAPVPSTSGCVNDMSVDDTCTTETSASDSLHDIAFADASISVPSAPGCVNNMSVHDTSNPEPSTPDSPHDIVLGHLNTPVLSPSVISVHNTSAAPQDTEADTPSTPVPPVSDHVQDIAQDNAGTPVPPVSDHQQDIAHHGANTSVPSMSAHQQDTALDDANTSVPSMSAHQQDTTLDGADTPIPSVSDCLCGQESITKGERNGIFKSSLQETNHSIEPSIEKELITADVTSLPVNLRFVTVEDGPIVQSPRMTTEDNDHDCSHRTECHKLASKDITKKNNSQEKSSKQTTILNYLSQEINRLNGSFARKWSLTDDSSLSLCNPTEKNGGSFLETIQKQINYSCSESWKTASEFSSETDLDKSNDKKVSVMSNPELKYRLELSGIHVETDTETECRHQCVLNGSDTEADSYCQCKGSDRSIRPSELKLDDFLKPPTLSSRQHSIWSRVSSGFDKYDVSPNSSTDMKMAEELWGSRQSSLWSSFEEISTPSHTSFPEFGKKNRSLNHDISTSSITSVDNAQTDLRLQAKMKIADKPVRCLTTTRCFEDQAIVSCSGSYGDDEAVLKWRKEPEQKIWTNTPVLEVCPETNRTRLPSYMRGRLLSSSSSHPSVGSIDSVFSFHSQSSQQTLDGERGT